MSLLTILMQQPVQVDYFTHLWHGMLSSVIYAAIGILISVVSYFIIDRIIPGNMGKQIAEDRNVAVAIVAGAFILGICIIIAASIAG